MSGIWTKPTTMQVVAQDDAHYERLVERARALSGMTARVEGASGFLIAPALLRFSANDETHVVELEFNSAVLEVIGKALSAKATLDALEELVKH